MHPSPLAPGLSSLFLIIIWHVLNIPLVCHNYPGNIHFRRSIFVWGGTGTDKACGTLLPLIQMILHIMGGFRYVEKQSVYTLDGSHDFWSIFPNIYTVTLCATPYQNSNPCSPLTHVHFQDPYLISITFLFSIITLTLDSVL